MSRFPNWGGSDPLTVEKLRQMIPDIYTKTTAEARNNTTTLSNDAELTGIPLGVGTWHIKLLAFASCPGSATPDLKTQWAFTGTWNNPIRNCHGPGTANTAIFNAITPMNMAGYPAATNAVYGLAASAGYNAITEELYNATVTVAGNLSLQYAQNTATATDTFMLVGTTFQVRQIA